MAQYSDNPLDPGLTAEDIGIAIQDAFLFSEVKRVEIIPSDDSFTLRSWNAPPYDLANHESID